MLEIGFLVFLGEMAAEFRLPWISEMLPAVTWQTNAEYFNDVRHTYFIVIRYVDKFDKRLK